MVAPQVWVGSAGRTCPFPRTRATLKHNINLASPEVADFEAAVGGADVISGGLQAHPSVFYYIIIYYSIILYSTILYYIILYYIIL